MSGLRASGVAALIADDLDEPGYMSDEIPFSNSGGSRVCAKRTYSSDSEEEPESRVNTKSKKKDTSRHGNPKKRRHLFPSKSYISSDTEEESDGPSERDIPPSLETGSNMLLNSRDSIASHSAAQDTSSSEATNHIMVRMRMNIMMKMRSKASK